MSALLTTGMMQMKATVEALQAVGLNGKVKTVVAGQGPPVTNGFSKQSGADGYAVDAASAMNKVKELLNIP
jgi:5-methyltetrahydrofolate--homocysteine methyltransferase